MWPDYIVLFWSDSIIRTPCSVDSGNTMSKLTRLPVWVGEENAMNLGTYLDQKVDQYGDKPYLFFYDQIVTYREFGERVDKLAHGLLKLGFKKGDVIHVWLQNSPENLICYFAIQKIGAIAGPINGLWKAEEVTYLLNDSGGKGLILGSQYAPTLGEMRESCPDLKIVIEIGEQSHPDHIMFDDLMADVTDERFHGEAGEEDPAYIFYTSGTTGNPKGVLLSHKNVFADILSFQEAVNPDEDHRILIFLPLFHVNAMLTSTSTLEKGGAVVLRKQFNAREFWSVVEKYRVNFFSAVPAVYNILLTLPRKRDYDISSLQFGICGAAPMPIETFKAFEDTFKVPIVEGYGLTEGTCVSTLNPRNGVRKVGSIGIACPGQEVLITNEDGEELPANEKGEIVITGDVVMIGYHNRPKETEEALAGGVLHTGDVGYKDEDGYIYIVDRLKDLVIRGGENIYPKEIDCLLVEHPKIKDAACVGVKDDVMGEEICAYVILQENETLTTDEIADYLKEHLAVYKVPKHIKVLEHDFPRNAVGKVLKKEMKQWSVRGVGSTL